MKNEMESALQTGTEGNYGTRSALDGKRELKYDQQEEDSGMNVNEPNNNADVSDVILDDGAFVSTEENGEDTNNEKEGSEIVFDDFGLRLEHVFVGDATGVKVVSSGYVKRSSCVLKDMDSLRRGVEFTAEASTEDNSDFEDLGRRPVLKKHGYCLLYGKCGHLFHNDDAVS